MWGQPPRLSIERSSIAFAGSHGIAVHETVCAVAGSHVLLCTEWVALYDLALTTP
jgi:hypothetical protein